MKLTVARLIIFSVLSAFTLYLVPHEAVHIFYDHEDTEHTHCDGSSLELSEKHIHCDFLSWYLSEYLPEESTDPVLISDFHFCILHQEQTSFAHRYSCAATGRGPPETENSDSSFILL